jgi:hypothetical protein
MRAQLSCAARPREIAVPEKAGKDPRLKARQDLSPQPLPRASRAKTGPIQHPDHRDRGWRLAGSHNPAEAIKVQKRGPSGWSGMVRFRHSNGARSRIRPGRG